MKSVVNKEILKMKDRQIVLPIVETQRLLSRQGLELTSPAKGQLHRIAVSNDDFSAFAYVIAVENGSCDVMLGDKDAMMASANDIVLPPSVLGDYVMLSPGVRAIIPATSLGSGFALLDGQVRKRIDLALEKYDAGADDLGFVRGYPYVSMFDDRIAYRLRMSRELALMEGRRESPFIPARAFEPDYALAAAEAPQAVEAKCKVEGLEGMVHVRYAPADRHLMLRVFGPDHYRSQAFDGWGVFGSDAECLGTIEDGCLGLVVEGPFNGVLSLVDEKGNIHPLRDDAGKL